MAELNEYKLVQTCGACPEQYDVFLGSTQVGYLRLRHGYFYAETTHDEKQVYHAHPKGDGIFEPDERQGFLDAAISAIDDALNPPAPVQVASVKEARMTVGFAVFNQHVNDAAKRAKDEMRLSMPTWLEEIEKIEEEHGGIMAIFNKPPTPAIGAYTALVTFLVNEDRE